MTSTNLMYSVYTYIQSLNTVIDTYKDKFIYSIDKGLDLGELMKDVGLDELDGYNTVNETSGDIVTSTVPNAIITSQSPANMVTFAASGGNQIVAQIPQQIVQVNLHFYWKNIAK